MRDTLLLFHRWLGLVVAVFVFIIALSGGALTFESAIDRAQHPELWRVEPGRVRLPLDTLAQRAKDAAGGATVTGMTLPSVSDRAVIVSAGPRQLFVNPFTGQVNGIRISEEFSHSLPRVLHRLHIQLLNKRSGGGIVAIMTLAALLLTISGLIVWWRDKRWKIRLSASWKRVVFDLHHSLGVAASILLLVITSSGLVMHYESLGAALATLGGTPPSASPSQPPPAGVATAIGFDSAAVIGHTTLPAAELVSISLPPNADAPIRVSLRFREDKTPGGRSRVYIDRYRGTVIGLESTRGGGVGARLNNRMRSIHTGDLFGAPTRAIWFVCAMILAWQALSGALMWWNQRGARNAAAGRRA